MIGEIKYGDYLLEELEKRLPFLTDDNYYHKRNFISNANFAQKLKQDLWLIGYSPCACELCAIYQNRIYSYSGNDKRFPKLPKFIKETGCIHLGSHNSIDSIFYYDEFDMYKRIYKNYDDYTDIKVDPIAYSNRPFVDDRSEIEKQHYINGKKRRELEKQADECYYNRNYWIKEYYKHLEYQKIVELLGDKAPKSYSGYMRMKKNNTINYQKIVKMAEENNIKIN